MAEVVQTGSSLLLPAAQVAETLTLRRAPNGVRYTSFGETRLSDVDLARIIQAVPAAISPALADRGFYFVPLAMAESERKEEPLVAPVYTTELSDDAICHRNVALAATSSEPAHEGVFISARLLEDNFALAFEFFINVGHAFAAAAGIPDEFTQLAWNQALANTRGETSQDAWEARADALTGHKPASTVRGRKIEAVPAIVDEKAKTEFLEAAFADALAIYQLSLAVDFDYSELREREYPLLAPTALADRLRLMAKLFPPSEGYEFAIKYRRRA